MSGGLFAPGRRALTVGLVLTVTLVASEALAVGTILPLVARELGDIELYGWTFTAFFLGSLIGIVVVGGLIDRGGIVLPFAAGLALFGLGLVVGGLAPSMPVLVLGRFLQGLGAGTIPPIAYVAIGRTLPEALRARMFAVLSTAWVIPGVVGPAIAGAVGETIGWRWVFLGLLPFIGVAGAMTLAALRTVPPGSPAEHEAAIATTRRLPLALLVTLGAGLVMAGLTVGQPLLLGPLVVAGTVLAVPAFVRLAPPGTLRLARGLPAAVGLRGVLTFAFFAADAYIALLLVEYRDISAFAAGLALTSATLTWTGGAWIQAQTVERWPTRRFVGAGFAIVALGTATTALVLLPEVPWPVAIVTWGVTGLGMGLSYAAISLAVLRAAPVGGEGGATSAMQLSDTLGTALGAGIGGALIAAGVRAGAAEWVGLGATFALATAVALVGLATSGRLADRPPEGVR
jgi:MFS family permease